MKKIALVFLLAVFTPSLVLAWLAVRSLHDQQIVLERQRSLLYQGVADTIAKSADDTLAGLQREFGQEVEALLTSHPLTNLSTSFNHRLRAVWPPAEIGFAISPTCSLLSPLPGDSPLARKFYDENKTFLSSAQSAEVYLNNSAVQNSQFANNNAPTIPFETNLQQSKNSFSQKVRNVIPQQSLSPSFENNSQPPSKLAATEGEFRQLVGDSREGTVARFLDNKLNILLWYRSQLQPGVIFGAQLSLPRLKQSLAPLVEQFEPALRDEIAVALLDENARQVAVFPAGFRGMWKHPFVATELGESLPHWETAVYLLHPASLVESARTLRILFGWLIGLLLLAIVAGGWLIVADLHRQLAIARQKTDFVSNVSHELKTPLTSIRMFSELLAENRVNDPEKRRSYLNIITTETSRLSRLINNVLDFARAERGETKYHLQPLDLNLVLDEIAAAYRPQLESRGFRFTTNFPATPINVLGDRDALAQVLVNLLSNAEKYSLDRKQISLEAAVTKDAAPAVEVRVSDRGSGVPRGCERKIFEQFYRAHDSLSSGISGSGLGLTIARQIARGHGGDVTYEPVAEGGSCFIVRLPLAATIS